MAGVPVGCGDGVPEAAAAARTAASFGLPTADAAVCGSGGGNGEAAVCARGPTKLIDRHRAEFFRRVNSRSCHPVAYW